MLFENKIGCSRRFQKDLRNGITIGKTNFLKNPMRAPYWGMHCLYMALDIAVDRMLFKWGQWVWMTA